VRTHKNFYKLQFSGFKMSTEAEREIKIDVRPMGTESAVVWGSFGDSYEDLTNQGYKIISLPQNVELIMQRGKDFLISRSSYWTREGLLYIPGKGNKLVRNSPLLQSSREVTTAHAFCKEFYLNEEQVEVALEDSVDFPIRDITIPTGRFDSDALTVYAFGKGDAKKARTYGEFLKDSGVEEMLIWAISQEYVSAKGKPFARQVIFKSLDRDMSQRLGSNTDFDTMQLMRGVKEDTEGYEFGVPEAYTPDHISKVLKRLNIQGLERGLINELRK
jgi:hypothetical protein